MIRSTAHSTSRTDAASAGALSHQRFMDASLFNLFWIFVIASFVGLVGETVVSAFMDGYVKSRAGLVWGPFSPLYGLGAVLMTVAVNDLKGRSPLVIIVVAGLVGGLVEYAAGWFWETFFGIVAWSYAGQPFNIGNYTCLGTMIVWGVAGYVWAKAGIPLVMSIINLIPRRLRTVLTVAMVAFMAADIAMTLASFNFWFERLAGNPVDAPLEMFFAANYGDTWMQNRFQALSMYAELATGR